MMQDLNKVVELMSAIDCTCLPLLLFISLLLFFRIQKYPPRPTSPLMQPYIIYLLAFKNWKKPQNVEAVSECFLKFLSTIFYLNKTGVNSSFVEDEVILPNELTQHIVAQFFLYEPGVCCAHRQYNNCVATVETWTKIGKKSSGYGCVNK